MILKIQTDFFQDKNRYMYTLLLNLVNDAKANGAFSEDADAAVIVDYLLVVARGLLFDWVLAHAGYDLVAKMEAYIHFAMTSRAYFPFASGGVSVL